MTIDRGIWIVTEEIDFSTKETTNAKAVDAKSGNNQGPSYPNNLNQSDRQSESEPSSTRQGRQLSRISASDLRDNLNEFIDVIEETLTQTEAREQQRKSPFQLDELELSVEINGKGQVCLLGNGAEAGAKGAIKLKFKRSSNG